MYDYLNEHSIGMNIEQKVFSLYKCINEPRIGMSIEQKVFSVYKCINEHRIGMSKVDHWRAACAVSLNDNGWTRALLAGLTPAKISDHKPLIGG